MTPTARDGRVPRIPGGRPWHRYRGSRQYCSVWRKSAEPSSGRYRLAWPGQPGHADRHYRSGQLGKGSWKDQRVPDVERERVDLLLASPLGREWLWEFLGILDTELRDRLGLGDPQGVGRSYGPGSEPPPKPKRNYDDWPNLDDSTVMQVFEDIVRTTTWRTTITELDSPEALMGLARITYSFGFSPGGESLWGLTHRSREALRPIAELLVTSPALDRWWDPMVRGDQRLLLWDNESHEALEEWVHTSMGQERAENDEARQRRRPRERPGVRIGAEWWSAPNFAQNTWTTGAFGEIPTIALGLFIDTYTPFEESEATVWSLEVPPDARIYEVQQPEDWRLLVERNPWDVTGTHDGEWRYWGDVDGPWFLPDWEKVMEDYDGVHVSVGGYLSSCGLALPVPDGYTMLSGWIPDSTVWLRDVGMSRRLIGTWSGNPHGVQQDWDSVMAGWKSA